MINNSIDPYDFLTKKLNDHGYKITRAETKILALAYMFGLVLPAKVEFIMQAFGNNNG